MHSDYLYRLINKLPVFCMRQVSGDIEEHVERRFHMAAPVPAEDELFEVAA